ncbi:MAG: NAD(P)H-dependent oxidoreductase [Chloroflexi bacterium]|nr:NAD(P)H-dependent oxidoreductase [Chloroflexota bacterium]
MEASPVVVVGISGSLRRASLNSAALRAAAGLAPAGMTIAIAHLDGIPLYSADVEADGAPLAVTELVERLGAADAVLIATPEYNYSVPGVLKNAIDWVSRPPSTNPLRGKPVAIMGAGGRVGTVRAQLHLRHILGSLDAVVLPRPEVLIIQAPTKFDADGNLTDDNTRGEIVAQLTALADLTRRLRVG